MYAIVIDGRPFYGWNRADKNYPIHLKEPSASLNGGSFALGK